MKRTALTDRTLPPYTKGEEIFNMVTHVVGASIGVAVLVLCIIEGALNHSGYDIGSGIVYGISMILLFTMSSIYHGLSSKHSTAKKVFQIMDHCTIFILIAGTYTPILLSGIMNYDPKWAWILFGIIWGVAIIGIVLNAIDIKSFSKFSMFLYLIMGWCIVFKMNLLPAALGKGGIILLVSGGVSYTIGTIFYGLQKKVRYMHSIWHLWIIFGAILHALCILIYVF